MLTAAHCFEYTKDPRAARAKAGATKWRPAGGWTEIERIEVHPQYDPSRNHPDRPPEHDIALVKLKLPPAGEMIPPARSDLQLRSCELLEVTGWGRTKEGGIISEDLLKAAVPYVDTATCNEPAGYNGGIRAGMICAGYDEGGVDACQGDSGGPLVYRGPDGPVLVGVVSWGKGCARKLRYGVYTRVNSYGDWITRVITSDRNQ